MPNPDDFPAQPVPDWAREILTPTPGAAPPNEEVERRIRELEREMEPA